MALRFPNMLLPGEILNTGEALVSLDQRFRLTLSANGTLFATAYTLSTGIKYFYSFPPAGAGATLSLGRASRPQFPSARDSFPAVLLRNSSGAIVWYSPSFGAGSPGWENHRFEMQSDGNIVHYAQFPATGRIMAPWQSETYPIFRVATAVAPNTIVAEIDGPGTLIPQIDAGNIAIVNEGIGPVGVRAGVDFLAIPQGGEISAAVVGTVSIVTAIYNWGDLYAANGTRPNAQELDALPAIAPSTTGERIRVYIGSGGSLRGSFPSPLGNLEMLGIGKSLADESRMNPHVSEPEE